MTWVTRELMPYGGDLLYCDACGAMLLHRYWTAPDADGKTYCSPACRALERRVDDTYARDGRLPYPSGTTP